MIRLIFLAVGLIALGALVWHVGPSQIAQTIEQLGFGSIAIILIPLFAVYLLEAYGWKLTLGRWADRVGFLRLFFVRTAGEAINASTPTGMVGGEPMKAYLLKQYDVPMVEALASLVTAKTAMVLAQILFMLLGIGLMVGILGGSDHNVLAAALGVGMLAFGLLMLFMIQRHGIGMGLLTIFRKIRLPLRFLESREAQLLDLDNTIRGFYQERAGIFRVTVLVYFVAWAIETFEVYAILFFLGMEVTLLAAFSIAAISVLIKGAGFFIPGSLGAQEGGYLVLLMSFGYDEVTGITFALIRRMREILWIIIGLLMLAIMKEKPALPSTISSP
jgi:putative membrane protein